MKQQNIKKLCVMAMLAAFAFVMVNIIRIPMIVPFLKYEPKDVVIAIGGFLYGPLSAFCISFVVSFLEMITISDTGWIGMIMNILSTCSFACTAALIYKKKHSLSGAITGLSLGVILMVGVMLAWNYVLTPLYMGQSRADVAAMLIPAFLPFNLIKGTLNAGITALLYRPLVQGLRRAGLFPKSHSTGTMEKKSQILFYAGTLILLALVILWALCFH